MIPTTHDEECIELCPFDPAGEKCRMMHSCRKCTLYTICAEPNCYFFVEDNYNPDKDPTLAAYVHLDNGEVEHEHDARPARGATLDEWRRDIPQLFVTYADGNIGPNSFYFPTTTGKDGLEMADTICTCGHWYEEHNDDDDDGPSCVGCDNSRREPDLSTHAFDYDAEGSAPEAIADRGGDPEAWPQRVKDYFDQAVQS